MSALAKPTSAPAGHSGGRWLIVYNCVHVGLTNCLHLLAPGLEVEAMDFSVLQREPETWRKRLPEFDMVVTAPHFLAGGVAGLAQARRTLTLPLTAFEAYHPDLCYIFVDGKVLRGPMFDYHSKIITAAYRRGLPASAVRALFNGANFERFGFFNVWEASKSQFLGSYAAGGVDLAEDFPQWSLQGAFMHSVNHPSIRVVRDIARALLRNAGVPAIKTDLMPHDNLLQAPVYPVYDEIAEALSIPGSYLFKVHNHYRLLDLDEFIAGSYEVLSKYPPEKIEVFPMYTQSMRRIEELL